jgi:ATP-dependent exoDNAse (exonuclease V) alpha subunit
VFIDFLNKVRLGNLSYLELNQLNHLLSTSLDRELITLTTTNHKALIINNENLLKNKHPEESSSAVIEGEFNSNNILAEEELVLKYDCKVMILANGTCFDDPNRAYFNGSIGLFRGFDVRWKKEYDEEEGKKVDVAIPVAIVNLEGRIIVVKEFTWSNFQYVEVKNINPKTNKITITIELQQVGSFTQIPLKLGYAFSIHKSQGLTFDGINIDLGQQTFSNGQLYVALSRCRTLEGINMFRKIYPSDIKQNKIIDNYLKENQNAA